MTRLSININKVALIRNARGAEPPSVSQFAEACLQHGADGITVHPRPDQRHIRYDDLPVLATIVNRHPNKTLTIEGYPSDPFLRAALAVKPSVVTLVPDPPEALTSSFGWDIERHHAHLAPIITRLHDAGIQVSLFWDPVLTQSQRDILSQLRPDCIELYTYNYVHHKQLNAYVTVSETLKKAGFRLHAGHDLNADNLAPFLSKIPDISEVSIGQAFVSDCLFDGLVPTLKRYRLALSGRMQHGV